jgi:formylmethanofuran dehydrogenase subunit B
VSAPERTVEHVTCLGCGCACDDIAVVVTHGQITEARSACGLGREWFGDGSVPGETRVLARVARLDQALAAATQILTGAARPLVYLAADVSCETQRETVAIADRLHAALDGLGAAAAAGVLAAQRRGRASATLGELRQRADLVVFWAVDPGERYPRYTTRYALEPQGLATPEGRASRRVIAVDVGTSHGLPAADARVSIASGDEVDALGVMRATVGGRTGADDARFQPAVDLARRMMQARYVALVADGEPGPAGAAPPDPDRAEALVALAQALNGPTRCALSTLRGGGNRAGAEAVLTWQTGFPMSTDFARGHPEYRPHASAAALLADGAIDAALVVGAPASLPEAVARGLAPIPTVVLGPRASRATFQPAVAIDTGIAGIHEGGTAFRMDDVPLPLRPALEGPRGAATTARLLRERLAS